MIGLLSVCIVANYQQIDTVVLVAKSADENELHYTYFYCTKGYWKKHRKELKAVYRTVWGRKSHLKQIDTSQVLSNHKW